MNDGIIFLFVILLLALILSTYLGSSVEGMTSNSETKYMAPDGATAIVTNSDGKNALIVTNSDGTTNTYSTSSGDTTNTFYEPYGSKAVIKTDNGSNSLVVTSSDGTNETIFTNRNTDSNSQIYNSSNNSRTSSSGYDNYNHFSGSSHASIYYGPDGGSVKVVDSGNGGTLVITNKNGATEIYYIDDNRNNNISGASYSGPNGGTAKMITDGNGKTAVQITRPNGTKVVYTEDNTYIANDNSMPFTNSVDVDRRYGPNDNTAFRYNNGNNNDYNDYNNSSNTYQNSLPPGIPRSQILPGQEDLYILKSQVVPPVCPICPSPIIKEKCDSDSDNSKCPPCPGPMRCPEPAFDCKKVPNYNAFNQNYMPTPVLNDFSGFGM